MEKLKLGVAYHGNRMLNQVQADMQDIIKHNMNLVVHMFSHNDMERNKSVMKDIISATKFLGLECWIDNWGIGGPPGDVSHILQFYRDSHQVNNKGEIDPLRICFNSPGYLEFTKKWIDAVYEAGGDTIFWDEPRLNASDDGTEFACCCERCKKLFEEKYNKPMPNFITPEVESFRRDSVINYFAKATAYAKEAKMRNTVCMYLDSWWFAKSIAALSSVDEVGTDPYWTNKTEDVYGFVYEKSKEFIDTAAELERPSHIWGKGYGFKNGFEDSVFEGTEAAYDAGARTILSWSFRAGEACDYRMQCPDLGWHIIGESMRRIRDRHVDECINNKRKKYGLI